MHVQRSYPAQFFTVYLGGIDVIGHRFWKYMEPTAFDEYHVTETEMRQFGDAVREYYRLVDEFVGEYLALADENTTVIVVSDHGMDDSGNHGGPTDDEMWVAFYAAGLGVGGAADEPTSILSVAPTVLTVMGLPVPAAAKAPLLVG